MKCKILNVLRIEKEETRFNVSLYYVHLTIKTPYGNKAVKLQCEEDSIFTVGDYIDYSVINLTSRFVNRLSKIGITIELVGNYPWLYLNKVNNVKITEKYKAEHGFTAFFLTECGCKWSNRSIVFNKIREILCQQLKYQS